VHVSDPGSAPTGPLTASLSLPAGVTLLGPVGSVDWTCTSSGCSHKPIGPGQHSMLSLQIVVVSRDGCGLPISATVTSGSLSVTKVSGARVRCHKGHPHHSPHPSHSPSPKGGRP